MSRSILVHVSGPDRPGITASLMTILAHHHMPLVDMGQSVTRGLLSLSFVVDFSQETQIDASKDFAQDKPEEAAPAVLKDLLFEAKKLGMDLEFKIVDEEEAKPRKARHSYILSCVSVDTISAAFLRDMANLLRSHEINIRRIDNLSEQALRRIEFTCDQASDSVITHVKADLLKLGQEHRVDLAFLKDDAYRRNKRLVVFDMDSTLITTEVIDELAKRQGVGSEISKITEAAMNGEIDFRQSLKERVSALAGLSEDALADVAKNLELNPGVEEFIRAIKKLGHKTAVISGGFTYFTNHLKDRLGLDYAFGNQLEIADKKLTGKVVGQVVDPPQKALILDLITQQEGIMLEQVVAIGDGANDLPMLDRAGLGIAFHAKKIVRENAHHSMGHGPMTSILHFLGIPDHFS